MSFTKLIGVLLIAAGALGLIYGGFSYTMESHETRIGPIQFSIKEKQSVNVPVWAGAGAIALGVVLLLVGPKR